MRTQAKNVNRQTKAKLRDRKCAFSSKESAELTDVWLGMFLSQ